MRVYEGVGVERHTFINSSLDIGKWIFRCSSRFFPTAQQTPMCQGLLIIKVPRSHTDTPHSVGLLWTSYQPDTGNSTWQHTTLTRERHPCPGGIQTHNTCHRTAAGPHLRPHSHWDRPWPLYSKERKESMGFRTGLDALEQNYSSYYKRESNHWVAAKGRGHLMTYLCMQIGEEGYSCNSFASCD